MLTVAEFYAPSAWGLRFGEWGPDYTIVTGRHIGLDIPHSGDVPALVGGVVTAVILTSTMARCVEVLSDDGTRLTYCHLADDNLPAEGRRLSQGDRVGRLAEGPASLPLRDPDFPGTAWTGRHLHLVCSRIARAAWTRVAGRTLGDFIDPTIIITSVLAGTASVGATKFEEWDTMASKDEIKAAVREVLAERTVGSLAIVPLTDGRIYLLSLITGIRAHIGSPYHVQLIQRAIDNNSNDTMLPGEVDIVAGYIAAVNPPTGATVDTEALAKRLGELDAADDSDKIRDAVRTAIDGATIKVSG